MDRSKAPSLTILRTSTILRTPCQTSLVTLQEKKNMTSRFLFLETKLTVLRRDANNTPLDQPTIVLSRFRQAKQEMKEALGIWHYRLTQFFCSPLGLRTSQTLWKVNLPLRWGTHDNASLSALWIDSAELLNLQCFPHAYSKANTIPIVKEYDLADACSGTGRDQRLHERPPGNLRAQRLLLLLRYTQGPSGPWKFYPRSSSRKVMSPFFVLHEHPTWTGLS